MRKFFCLLLGVLSVTCFAEVFFEVAEQGEPVSAVTDEGDKILLYRNGQWRPLDGASVDAYSERLFSPVFRHKYALGEKDKFGVWYDPAKWTQTPTRDGYALNFSNVNGVAYAYAKISPKKCSPQELYQLAVNNASLVVENMEVLKKATLNINGDQILALTLQGVYFGDPITAMVFMGYFYSGDNGTIQLVAYTTLHLWEDFMCDMQNLLDGLAIHPSTKALCSPLEEGE